jgi:molybdopterin-guanine dinucleotide biosynthesis protein A
MDRPPGVILAGGLSRRMGQDKAQVRLGGRRVVDHVIARLAPQVAALAVNTNDPSLMVPVPVLPDTVPGRPGPLAGILAALDWADALGARRVVTVAVDTPFLPPDLVERLVAAGAPAVAVSDRVHPVCGLWPVAAREGLRAAVAGGLRRVRDWSVVAAAVPVAFPAESMVNVNTPEDLAAAEARL